MTTRDTIDRRAVLATGIAACSAVALGGCSDDAGGGGTGGTGTGGAAATGGAAGTGGSGELGGAGMNTAGSSAGTGPAGQAGLGSPAGGMGASGMAGGGLGGGGVGGMGEMAGTGGAPPPRMCEAEVSPAGTPMHTHPLTIPGSDVDQGFSSADHYILEDGGTGHTHTIQLSAYDFVYLQGGSPATVMSSTDMDHSHSCTVTCTQG